MDTSTGMKMPRLHGWRGEDYGLSRHWLRAGRQAKGVGPLLEIIATSSEAMASSETSPVKFRKLLRKREKASDINIFALGEAPLRFVIGMDQEPDSMLRRFDRRYASNLTLSRIAVQTQLLHISYTGHNVSEYMDEYTTLLSKLDRNGRDATIPETHKPPMLLASINPLCSFEFTAATLRTKNISDLTWDSVAKTLIDEYNEKLPVVSSFSNKIASRPWGIEAKLIMSRSKNLCRQVQAIQKTGRISIPLFARSTLHRNQETPVALHPIISNATSVTNWDIFRIDVFWTQKTLKPEVQGTGDAFNNVDR